VAEASHGREADDDDGAGDGAGGAVVGTIYVKNLAFATTDKTLKKHFDK
jgi:hypothetical protein